MNKLDEIPQLINIIKGEMRFIGYKPEVKDYFNRQEFRFLKNVKPGISDFASIILRNESKILDQIGGEEPYEKLLPIKNRIGAILFIEEKFLVRSSACYNYSYIHFFLGLQQDLWLIH